MRCNGIKYGILIMHWFFQSVTSKRTNFREIFFFINCLLFKIKKRVAKRIIIRHYSNQKCGTVVQLVRAPPCHGGGRGFESRQSRRNSKKITNNVKLLRFLSIIVVSPLYLIFFGEILQLRRRTHGYISFTVDFRTSCRSSFPSCYYGSTFPLYWKRGN